MKSLIKGLLGVNIASLQHIAKLRIGEFVQACERAFQASRLANPPSSIPSVHLGAILGNRKPEIGIVVSRYEDGMLPSNQAMALLAILVAESPSVVLEIGTFMGHTTRQMAENLPNAIINTVDLPEDFTPARDDVISLPKDDFHLIEKRRVGREFKGKPCEARIRQHFGDTAKWDFYNAAAANFFFIDGSHTYEYCKNDSEKCFQLCGGKGTFLWHDCDPDHPGVVRFVQEWRALGRDIRVIEGTPIAYWSGIGS